MATSLGDTIKSVIRCETKAVRARLASDGGVSRELNLGLVAIETRIQKERAIFQEELRRKREAAREKAELKLAKEELKKTKKSLKEVTAVVAAAEALKTFTPVVLGHGKKNAGGVQCQKSRFEVLDRVRRVAELSQEQRNDWDHFKTNWDKAMVESHGDTWGGLFSEIIQKVVGDLQGGATTALSEFMHNETTRVLGGLTALVVPGVGTIR